MERGGTMIPYRDTLSFRVRPAPRDLHLHSDRARARAWRVGRDLSEVETVWDGLNLQLREVSASTNFGCDIFLIPL